MGTSPGRSASKIGAVCLSKFSATVKLISTSQVSRRLDSRSVRIPWFRLRSSPRKERGKHPNDLFDQRLASWTQLRISPNDLQCHKTLLKLKIPRSEEPR